MIRSPRRPSPPSRINRILIPSIFVCGFTFVLSTVFCLFLLPARQRSDIQIHTTFSPYKEDPTFPVHVNEWEEINHPGMEAMGKIVRVKVPQFFTHPALPSMNATTEAPPLLTRKQALAIGTRYNGQLETIFLSIASYRDPECRNTLADAFRYAKYPERVRVAIVDQIVQGDIDCVTPASYCDESTSATSEDPLCRYRKNIDYFKLEASLAVGPVFARHLAHRMYRGEYFAMQIDAHVRFTKEWDDDIITQWKYTENEMAVLSTYVSEINKHLNLETRERILGVRPIMCNTKYTSPGHPLHHLTHGVQPEMNPRDGNVPIMHPFWAAGFSFARGHFVLQVPYDQYLPMVFQGEEISMGIRGFTYGYDFYAPARNVIYHMYASEHPERKTVKKFWEHSQNYPDVSRKSMRRLCTIIHENEWDDEWNKAELNKYGIGSVRKAETFFETFGIDHQNNTVEEKLCQFVEFRMTPMFKKAMREDGMGVDYSKIDFKYKFAGTNANKKH